MKTFHSPSDLAIIIPVGPGETNWQNLLECLAFLPATIDILLVTGSNPLDTIKFRHLIAIYHPDRNIQCYQTQTSRAEQMNFGARQTQKAFLWFIHADSFLTVATWNSLQAALIKQPKALHYFNLAFVSDKHFPIILNQYGSWIRSHCLHLPFGDQAFCIAQSQFKRLGGFPLNRAYGEDHALIWKAHRLKIKCLCTGGTVWTSARKYEQQGWLTTTAKHVYRTCHQAFQEYFNRSEVSY